MNKQKFKKHWKVRTRFTIGFFKVVFPFFFFTMVFLNILNWHGISLIRILGPAFFPFLLCTLCIILGYVASLVLMDMIFSPLEQLSEASKKVARGDYNIHLEYNGNIDELENTFQNFNFMVHELNSVEIMGKDFIANVSHEFKTPLSSISGYVTLLQDPDLSEEERNEYIQMAFFNIEKLNDLTGNILELSRLESQNFLQPPKVYRLDEQIREAIVLLEPKWTAKQLNLDINLEETSYAGQQSLLFQVWTNLIGNAIKFSNPDGNISITLHNGPEDIEVIISDDGIGMSEETLAHIFDKFYQGDSSRRSQGNGLGLALCKKILDLCNGKIYVSSSPKKGSVFMVRLNKTPKA